jgi:ferredoxin-NADP reductase
MAFYFERPQNFAFRAGQHMTIEFPAPYGNARKFSLAGAPHEDPLMIATRLRDSDFKRSLANQRRGTRLVAKGPSGTFTLPDTNSSPIVLVAGGIGITPFRSMLVHLTTAAHPPEITLIYSNRRPEDAVFLAELRSLERRLGNFTFVATMTRMNRSVRHWDGETLRVDEVLLYRYVRNLERSIFYVAGPPRMVNALKDVLPQAGVEWHRLHTETFSGY